jgi:serine/threonine protein kinase
MFKQLARGLTRIHHEEDLCLLNLSLSKVLLDNELSPKFFDFSRARDLNDLVLTPSELLASLSHKLDESNKVYLAPEVLSTTDRGQPIYGEKVDIFALGVMLFISVFKAAPFRDATQKDQFYRMISSKNPKL